MESRNIFLKTNLKALYFGTMDKQNVKSSVLILDLSGEIRNEKHVVARIYGVRLWNIKTQCFVVDIATN